MIGWAKTDMFGLQEQYANYLKEIGRDESKMTPAEVDKLKKEFYKQALNTAFDHKVYNDGWFETLSTTIDYIPLVGGVKSLIEGAVGTTMTGEQLSANEKVQYMVMGTISTAVDAFTFGTATAAIQGTKTAVKIGTTLGKIAIKDVGTGWALNLGSQALAKVDLPPELAFVAHIGLNLIISKQNNIKRVDHLAKEMGLEADQVKDLMKYTGKNLDAFEKAVKNGGLDELLGLSDMNMSYLIKQTGKSADEINEILKNKKIDLKDINSSNIDGIIEETNGFKFTETFNNWDDMKNAHKGSVTQFVKDNKPLGSTHPRDWLKDGGSLTINTLDDGTQVWKYTKDGITVPYVPKMINGEIQNVVQFPKKYLYNELLDAYGFDGSFKIPEGFTGNRSKDTANALAFLKKEFRINEIPDGYILHHDVINGSFQLVQEDVHGVFRHYGGYYFNK